MITERQRTEAMRICDEMKVTLAKLDADFAKLEEVAADFRRDFEEWQRSCRPTG